MISSEKIKNFSEEMLNEIKNLKDLTKEELPLIVKEYINYLKVIGIIYLTVGVFLLYSAIEAGLYVTYGEFEKYSDFRLILSLYCLIAGILGFLIIAINLDSLLKVFLQPRRTAIKAITSLFNGDE